MNVLTNFIPNKLITINVIKNKIKKRDFFHQQLKKYNLNLTHSNVMTELTLELSSIISQRKDEYYL